MFSFSFGLFPLHLLFFVSILFPQNPCFIWQWKSGDGARARAISLPGEDWPMPPTDGPAIEGRAVGLEDSPKPLRPTVCHPPPPRPP